MPAGGPLGGEPDSPALDGWWAIQVALASLDRLEVRGRDSAGLHVLVAGHGLDLADPSGAGRCSTDAAADPAVRLRRGAYARPAASAFVYKAAAEIGELGDNVEGPAGCHPQ